MIHNKIHIIKTTPYRIELWPHATIAVFMYDRIKQEFEKITLDASMGRNYLACRDEHNNLMLINKESIYYIHYGTTLSMDLDSFFRIRNKVNKVAMENMMADHASLRIKI